MTAASILEVAKVNRYNSVAETREIKMLHGAQIVDHMGELVELYRGYQEWPYLYQPNPSDDEAHIRSRYVNKEHGFVCVAIENGKIIGALMGMPLKDGKDRYKAAFPHNEFPPRTVFLGDTLVHPDFRHTGVARLLYKKFEEYSKGTGFYDRIALSMVERDTDFQYTYLKPEGAFTLDTFMSSLNFEKLGFYKSPWNLIGIPGEPYENTMRMWQKTIE